MDPAADGARANAEQWMKVAEKLLMARDFEGCREFSSQALAADPRTPGAEDLHAAADVLLAAQHHRIPNGQPDPYAVLGLDSADPTSRHPDAIHSRYRRLSLLLNRSHPDRPCSLSVAEAARLVADSWAFLSNRTLKSALDAELDAAAARTNPRPAPIQQKQQTPPPPQPSPLRAAPQPPTAATIPPVESGTSPSSTFWTVCRACCHIHQYDRLYESRRLKCFSCHQPFVAEAMAEAPPVVPGTDMYYCTWGFFPIGFPGCPGFESLVNSQPQGSGQLNAPWLRANDGVKANGGVGAENGPPVSAAVEVAAVVPEPVMPMGGEVQTAAVVSPEPVMPMGGEVQTAAVVSPEPVMPMGVEVQTVPTPTMAMRVEVPAAPEHVKPMRMNSVKVGAKKRGRPKGSKNKKKSE